MKTIWNCPDGRSWEARKLKRLSGQCPCASAHSPREPAQENRDRSNDEALRQTERRSGGLACAPMLVAVIRLNLWFFWKIQKVLLVTTQKSHKSGQVLSILRCFIILQFF